MAKEYIERESLLADLAKRYCEPCEAEGKDHNHVRCRACWVDDMMGEIGDAPFAADVVEVVRCKDCKYWHEETGWCYQHSHFIKYGENGVAFCHPWESADWKMFDADYFCKDGERRDNDADD